MNAVEVRTQIVNGQPFSFKSKRKKDRTLTITPIIRPKDGNLFLIKANDLKHAAGLYNETNILLIIELALQDKPQQSFRIR